MKLAALALSALLVLGCATVTTRPAVGTVLEKFARGGYVAQGTMYIGEVVPYLMAFPTTYWVSVQGKNCRIEQGMEKGRWDRVKVGDVIETPGSGGGT